MSFGDFWIQQNNSRKERLQAPSEAFGKERLEPKYAHLFDFFDKDRNGKLNAEEMEFLAYSLSAASGDNILTETESKSSIFSDLGEEKADFLEFVKAISDAVKYSKTEELPNGEKRIITEYKNGITDTIYYYPNGDFKFKVTEKKNFATIDNPEMELRKLGDGLSETRVKHNYKKVELDPDRFVYLSEQATQEVQLKNFVFQHFIDTNTDAQKAIDSVEWLDRAGNVIKEGLEELGLGKDTNNLSKMEDGIKSNKSKVDNLGQFVETSQYSADVYFGKYEDRFKAALKHDYNPEQAVEFQELTNQYQTATYLNQCIDLISRALRELDNYETDYYQQQTQMPGDNFNPMSHINTVVETLTQLFDDQEIAEAMVNQMGVNEGGKFDISYLVEQLKEMLESNKSKLQEVLGARESEFEYYDGDGIHHKSTIKSEAITYEKLKEKYIQEYKSMYNVDTVPEEVLDKVMTSKEIGGIVKIAIIMAIQMIITKQAAPVLATGGAVTEGAAALKNLNAFQKVIQGLIKAHGVQKVSSGLNFAVQAGFVPADIGLGLVNGMTSKEGLTEEKMKEVFIGGLHSAKYVGFGYAVTGRMSLAITQNMSKIGLGTRLFNGIKPIAKGQKVIKGADFVSKLNTGVMHYVGKGTAFVADGAAFGTFDALTGDLDLAEATENAFKMQLELGVARHFLETLLGVKVHARITEAKQRANLRTIDIIEDINGIKPKYIVHKEGKTLFETEDIDVATAQVTMISQMGIENYIKVQEKSVQISEEGQKILDEINEIIKNGTEKDIERFNQLLDETKQLENPAEVWAISLKIAELVKNIEIKDGSEETVVAEEAKSRRTLEGGVRDTDLTEVAPFARHLAPHSVTDSFRILAEDLDERANKVNFDLAKYEKTGFPLKYSRQEFTQRLKDLVNNMPIEAQREILKKFNIELNYTGDSFELRDVPKIPRDIKNPLEFAIKTEIERFTKENEIEIDNPEVKVFLDDFIKLAPEFLFIVGKKQHETHAYTVDVHTIKVLQNAIEHPEYKNLSAEDKMVLNTAILLHDIAKQFVDTKTPDDSHAEYGYNYAIKILDRFNLSNDIKQRIVKLIRNHEFFKSYNQAYIPFKSEAEQNELGRQNAEKNGYPFSPRNDYAPFFNREVEGNAGRILNTSDFRLAKILTYSDLKSVNPDKTFIREEWNIEEGENEPVEYQGFEKFVTGTHSDAEFKEYLDESLSYIEKELQKYDGGKIEDEFVYETELAETGLKLFGRTDFFESITRKSGQNQPYAVHRSDFNMIIQARQALIDAGVKEKEVGNRLRELFKRKNDMFSPEVTSEFIKVYLENKDFIDSHGIKLGGAYSTDLRNAEMLKKEIAIIKEKESVAEIFKKYDIKNEWMQKRLVDSLYTSEYNREIGKSEPVFSKEAHGAMLELFDLKKFTPDEIYNIIYNSFSVKNNRGNFRNNGNEGSCFNRQIFDTILELSKEEPLDNAIQDTHLCCVNPTPESGWVIAPEILATVKELNRMGIKDKGFILSTFDIKYKDGKGKNDNTRVLESITKNERYKRAIKYSKQGFNDFEVRTIIDTFEIENGKVIYPEAVQDKIANLVKLGVYEENYSHIIETLFDTKNYEYSFFKKETQKFNETNYNFIVCMINKGIPLRMLDEIIYNSGCQTYEAEKAAPDKMVETGKFSKAQVEAMVDFFKEIGFDKELNATTKNMHGDLAESFMDIVELTSEELEGMSVYSSYFDRMMPMSKMHNGMAPFRIVNKEKFNQALDYYKKGVSINNLKYLTETPELYKELKNEADLSFIKTENDADLVSTFWKMKDVKSINELSKQERIQFMNELMMHKSEIEGNNVSDKISILPKDSQGYSDMMKNIADSFGLNSEPYTQQKVSQINKSFSDISARLQTIKPSEIETDNSINQIINEITSIVPNLNRQNISSILLTLQRVVKSPEYQTLSENDKKLMNIAVVFSKVDSTSNNPFDSAIDACVFAKQIGLSDTDAMKIFAIVKNSNLTETVMSTKRNVKTNKSRSYIHIVTDDIKETFETAAMELKDYNNFQMAKLLYTANEDFVSPQMLQEYAPDLYKEFLNIRNSVTLENGEISKDAKAMQIMQNNPQYTDKLEEVKLKGRDKYSLSRNLNKLLEEQIDEIKSCDVLLPQTNLSDFIAKQSPDWIQEHTQNVNGRNVLVIGSDEIPDFYMLSHTTQAFNISGKADATTNMSNFENFAMLFNDKTICLSYSGNGKIAVVGNVGLLIQTPNTSQYIARGTDISSVAKDIPTMISEYISHRSQIVQKGRYQTKATKDYDRNFFASLIKEELSPGYRTLLDQKISLEEQIREYNSEKTNESLESLQQKLKDVKNQMRPIDKIYRMRIENLINKANGEVIDLEFIRNNDPELGTIYDKILNTINVEHRGNDGIMRTEYHNEVLGSNTKPVGLFVRGDKELFNLTDDYLKKAEEDVLPIVIYK